MSSLDRALSGTGLHLSLTDEMRIVREELKGAGERIGRTLIKNGPLRATLVGVKPGGGLDEHRADGPITVQVLEGALDFHAGGKAWPLGVGSLFTLDAGVAHSVTSRDGALFLLTISAHPARSPARQG